ncbi:ethanolamine utilization protein EutH, partial [Paenibacillus alvei]|uniref:ethanolamine utilization protein EutH n=1 Tax=Paenibacillus alvei TaxID=44250 RepID=UPI003CC81912
MKEAAIVKEDSVITIQVSEIEPPLPDPKASVLPNCVAFAVSAAFVFGDHLGFTAGVA